MDKVNKNITLREISADTVRSICDLLVTEVQNNYVAPNATSIAEAYYSDDAWFRARYADETPVGFAMLEIRPEKAHYYLWRFMIDARYQRSGFGSRAMQLLMEHVKVQPGATKLLTGDDSPQGFMKTLDFI